MTNGKTFVQENLPDLGKNSERLWHLSHDLLHYQPLPAPPSRSSMSGKFSQEDGAPSPPSCHQESKKRQPTEKRKYLQIIDLIRDFCPEYVKNSAIQQSKDNPT